MSTEQLPVEPVLVEPSTVEVQSLGPAVQPLSLETSTPEDGEPAQSEAIASSVPSWLASLLLHMVIILALALWTLPLTQRQPTSLSVSDSDIESVELNEEVMDIEIDPVDISLDETTNLDMEAELETEIEVESLDDSQSVEMPDNSLAMLDFSADVGLLQASPTAGAGMSAAGLSGRSAAGRRRMIRKGGGTDASERAVDESLKWLVRHQLPDGSWNFDHRGGECQGQCSDPGDKTQFVAGATGLALLPFLGAGNTHREGKYRDVVERGAAALVRMLKITPAGATVIDSQAKDQHWMYSHGIASMALSEAYAMTEDENLRDPAQALLAFTCNAQDPQGGGWRYKPRQPGDTSVMGWQVGALKSGYMASLNIPPIVVDRAGYFLDSVQEDDGARYKYLPDSKSAGAATSAIGLLCRMYMGAQHENKSLQKGVERLVKIGPSRSNVYFNYYAAQVIYQYTSGEGDLWKKWNEKMRGQLVSTQETAGHAAGSWTPDPELSHDKQGGRLYVTAMSAMTLEVYYRLMPIYQEKAMASFEQ